ncbi:MAG: ribonuclease III [Gammaproteobacteria bacterium]|nr:ribonuclease III [Gammaproteobacteria bacterium]
MKNTTDFSKLLKVLGYQFSATDLLQDALTHRSASSRNNERLEFLGDSILNFVIAAELYDRYPDASEGDLSRVRASLVNKDGLAIVARDLNLGEWLILGSGELKSGGYRRNSILADTVEAIFGAVYLDAGFDTCKEMILRLYQNQIHNVPDLSLLKDPKTRLQELLQSRKLALPVYEVKEVTGKAHQQNFKIVCQIESLLINTQGQAGSRRKAEQLAAEQAIQQVEEKLAQNKATR